MRVGVMGVMAGGGGGRGVASCLSHFARTCQLRLQQRAQSQTHLTLYWPSLETVTNSVLTGDCHKLCTD